MLLEILYLFIVIVSPVLPKSSTGSPGIDRCCVEDVCAQPMRLVFETNSSIYNNYYRRLDIILNHSLGYGF